MNPLKVLGRHKTIKIIIFLSRKSIVNVFTMIAGVQTKIAYVSMNYIHIDTEICFLFKCRISSQLCQKTWWMGQWVAASNGFEHTQDQGATENWLPSYTMSHIQPNHTKSMYCALNNLLMHVYHLLHLKWHRLFPKFKTIWYNYLLR